MKKNLVMRIAAVVLMCTLVTACFASSTFAKYTSAATSNADTLTVAAWSIKFGTTDITLNKTFTFDLFDTANIQHHANSDTAAMIAPGTWGEINFEDIKNDSDVDAKIKILVNTVENTNNIPVKFYKTKNADGTFANEITPVQADTVLLEETILRTGATLADQTIYWAWDFTANGDASDTALGVMAQTNDVQYKMSIKVVATQMDEG